MQADVSQTPTDLVQNVLLGGGVTASNITYTCGSTQMGYFFGSSNLGLSSGIIMSTGFAIDIVGPNDNLAVSNLLLGPGDFTLDAVVAPLTTNDACVLEFDFIPLTDTVSFRYVFGSEEYAQFVGTSFNDVFGFFISGPGIPVPTNIAIVPGTVSTPVSINNVNGTTNSAYYVNNGDLAGVPQGQTVQYNGFTTVLTATSTEVTHCETYHIKLAIADVGDGAYDSGVFLEAGSFSSGTVSLSSQADYSSSLNDTALFEGCGSTKIIFERGGNTSEPLTINFNVTGTATQGVDYTLSSTSVTIPAGFNIASIDLNTIYDNVSEPLGESVTITPVITFLCAAQTPPSITLTLADQPPLSVTTSPDFTTACPAQTTFEAFPQGGIPGYVYEWKDSTGTVLSTQSTLTAFPLQTTHYSLTVTDTCKNQQATATASVIIPGYTPMQFELAQASICKGDTARLVVNVTEGKAPYTYLWPSTGSINNFTFVAPSVSGSFTVQVTDLCGIVDNASSRVSVVGPKAQFSSNQTAERDFVFTNQSVDAIFYYWNFDDGDTAQTLDAAHSFPDSGWYNVLLTVENREGCFDTASLLIHAFPDLNVYIPNAFTPNGDGKNDSFYADGEGFATSDMKIYDRWGQEVYHAEHQAWAWNGQSRSGVKLEGMYCYVFEFVTPLGNAVKRMGHVMVVR